MEKVLLIISDIFRVWAHNLLNLGMCREVERCIQYDERVQSFENSL
jgi:hypothetical protein